MLVCPAVEIPRVFLGLAALVLSAGTARAGEVELSPFAGVQYGGSVESVASGRPRSFSAGFQYGGALDVAIGDGWGAEVHYSRQESELSGDDTVGRFELAVERFLAGVWEEKGEGRTKVHGTFLLGVTRFTPGLGGFDSDVRFTAELGLGLKTRLSKHFGLRADVRGYFVVVDSGGGTVCSSGACLFRYSATGLFQGDLTAGVVIVF